MDEPFPATGDDRPVRVLATGPEADPYALYDEMRAEGLVHHVREPNGLHRWLVLDYAEAREIFADARFSKNPARAWEQLRDAGYVSGEPGDRADYLYHVANTDPPDHTRLRKLIGKAFTTRRVEAMRPRIREVAAGLLDRMETAETETVDLVDVYSHPLATTVMCEILGIPALDRESFRTWATAMLSPPEAAARGAMSKAEGYAAMRAFFTDLIGQKRAAVHDGPAPADVLSALIHATDDGDQLTETELVSTVMLLMSAGQEPTVNLINNGALALMNHPEQLALLRDKPELTRGAVEEFLRYDPPVQLSTTRVAVEDVEVAGTVIPAGAVVALSIAAAGRDENRFADADRLDVTRDDNPHLAFGHGIHHCVGAPLARVQGEIGIGMLIERFPRLSLACPPEDLRWRPTRIMRGLVELPVRLDTPPGR
ncbi:cytochrome P450 family protein [Streptomyces parvus]|uniref:Cytochrome P450 n=1 Tax=Streptomyces parvus TaxID=66428 RepID=A0A7K3S961_9ACTN|nr:cytochrome P450 [Streptomyces parvus]NEC23322.1 cytochrome P450 [Streptomyces parvus]